MAKEVKDAQLRKAIRAIVSVTTHPGMLISSTVRIQVGQRLGFPLGSEHNARIKRILREEVAVARASPKKSPTPPSSTPRPKIGEKRPRSLLNPLPGSTTTTTTTTTTSSSSSSSSVPHSLIKTPPAVVAEMEKSRADPLAPIVPSTTLTGEESKPRVSPDVLEAAAHAAAGVGSRSKQKHASTLPLVLPPATVRKLSGGRSGKSRKVHVLVQLDDSTMDLEGDAGAIGRLAVGEKGLVLDLKGHRYAGRIVPTASHLVVAVGPSEAKVEAVVDDVVVLDHLANVVDDLGGELVKGSETAAYYTSFEDLDKPIATGGDSSSATGQFHIADDDVEDGGGSRARKKKSASKPKKMIGKTRKVKRRKKS